MNKARVLLFGATGQVGREICQRAPRVGVDLTVLSRADVDLFDSSAVRRAILASDADIIVNAAAYTAVDRAETEEALAHIVNAAAPEMMARVAEEKNRALIHLSTDYVFDGEMDEPYDENDLTAPINAYGRTKLAGEEAIREACRRHVIVRTSRVFSPFGVNFVKSMLRIAGEQSSIGMVDDQYASPTAAGDIADAVLAIARSASMGRASWGTFHFTSDGVTTWRGFADAVFDGAAPWLGVRPVVEPIPSSDYPTPAERPANSLLDCSKISRAYGISGRPWREALAEVLEMLRPTYAKVTAGQ